MVSDGNCWKVDFMEVKTVIPLVGWSLFLLFEKTCDVTGWFENSSHVLFIFF